jgi:hypothetical protein
MSCKRARKTDIQGQPGKGQRKEGRQRKTCNARYHGLGGRGRKKRGEHGRGSRRKEKDTIRRHGGPCCLFCVFLLGLHGRGYLAWTSIWLVPILAMARQGKGLREQIMKSLVPCGLQPWRRFVAWVLKRRRREGVERRPTFQKVVKNRIQDPPR